MSEDARPIVICCDGTENTFGEPDTNVRRVYDLLNDRTYCRYYDPGLGTGKTEISHKKLLTKLKNKTESTVAFRTKEKVLASYKFLTDQYNHGASKVFLFGFSRGALTVRRLAKMVAVCGLPPKGGHNLIDDAYYAYDRFKVDNSDPYYTSFARLSRQCRPIFIGVWDTVRASGLDHRGIKCEMVEGIDCGRHALALDEKRSSFEPELWEDDPSGRIRQRWFPGDHSDVGGGHYEDEYNIEDLSYISLDWMLEEANKFGLDVECKKISKHSEKVRKEVWFTRKDVNDESDKFGWQMLGTSPRKIEIGDDHEIDPSIKGRVENIKDKKMQKRYFEKKNLGRWPEYRLSN